jgi:hypothetical protein
VNRYWQRTESAEQLIERLAIEDPKTRQLKVEAISEVGAGL